MCLRKWRRASRAKLGAHLLIPSSLRLLRLCFASNRASKPAGETRKQQTGRAHLLLRHLTLLASRGPLSLLRRAHLLPPVAPPRLSLSSQINHRPLLI
jgi:hypothetical protein